MSYDIPNKNGQTFGLRINNPADLRPSGFFYDGQIGLTDGSKNNGSAIFENMIYGLRAAIMDLNIKIDKDGLNTINKISKVFAPTSDGNNPTEWANNVSKESNIGINEILQSDNNTIGNLLKGVIFAEQGKLGLNSITDEDINQAMNLYNGENFSSSTTNNNQNNTGLFVFLAFIGIGYFTYKYALKNNF